MTTHDPAHVPTLTAGLPQLPHGTDLPDAATIDVETLRGRRAVHRWERTSVGDVFERLTWSRPDQVAIGLPASTNAGNGHTAPAEVNKALDCLTRKANCGSYQTHGTWPALRGLMTWSINWDRYSQWEFMKNFDAYHWN